MTLLEAQELIKWYNYFTKGHPNYPPGWNVYGEGRHDHPPKWIKEQLIKEGIKIWEV